MTSLETLVSFPLLLLPLSLLVPPTHPTPFLSLYLFPWQPQVESRQFPVTVHFNKRTPAAYLRAAYEKVVKIHRTLPAGHVLVFVTGRGGVLRLCRLLCSTFPGKLDPDQCRQLEEEEEEEEEDERRERRGRNRKRRRCRVDLDK